MIGMNETQRRKLFDICKRSKRGSRVRDAEHEWARKMWEKHRDEYCEIQQAASKEAVREYREYVGGLFIP